MNGRLSTRDHRIGVGVNSQQPIADSRIGVGVGSRHGAVTACDAVRVVGRRFLLVGDKGRPKLPAGFKFEGRGHFLIAVKSMSLDSDGGEFFIERAGSAFRLIRRRVATYEDFARTNGRLKLGDVFVDTSAKPIALGKEQKL